MLQKVHIRLAENHVNNSVALDRPLPKIFTPGEIICEQRKLKSGHDTYEEDNYLKASVADVKEQVISCPDKEAIGRIRNCILALVQSKMMSDTSILYAYEESLKYTVADLLIPEAMVDVVLLTT